MSDTTIKKINYSLDGQDVNYLRNFKLDTVTTDPDSNQANQLKLNTTENRVKLHDGTEVQTVAYLSDIQSVAPGTLVVETANLATLMADTPTDVVPTNLATVEMASVRSQTGEDLTATLCLMYGDNKVTLQSSVELNSLVVKLMGTAGTVVMIDWTAQTPMVIDLGEVDPSYLGFNDGFTHNDYAYYVPRNNGSPHGNLVRVDIPTFTMVESLDLTLTDPDLKGFRGGFVEGNYAYLVPLNNGSIFGKVVRVDLTDFSTVSVLDLTLTDPDLKGFTGGFSDGTYGYFVPNNNGANFGKLTRVLLSDFSTVEVLDLALTDPELVRFHNGFALNGYAYLGAEGSNGKVPKINLSDFSTVEVLDLKTTDPDLFGYPGIFTDGSYAYLVPFHNSNVAHHGKAVRIDLSDFATVEVLDLTVTDPDLKGFVKGFYANGYAYYAPHGGFSRQFMGKVTRVDVSDFATVEILDLTATDPGLSGFDGGFTDGTYGFFAPFYNGGYAGITAKIAV